MGLGAQPGSITCGQSKRGQRDSVRPESCKVGLQVITKVYPSRHTKGDPGIQRAKDQHKNPQEQKT